MNPKQNDYTTPVQPAVPGVAPNQPFPYGPQPPQPSTANNNIPGPPSQPSLKKPHGDGWKSIISTLLLFLLAPVIALTVAAFVIQSYQVDGESMETTLQHQDRLIVDKLPRTWSRITQNNYIPNRGDIIIFNQVDIPGGAFGEEKQLIKRVIALPGERITINDGHITIYSKFHPDGFDPDVGTGYKITAETTPGTVDLVVPENEVFVCGDNRINSEDSRYFGPVPAEKIVGKLVLRLLPLDKLQSF